MKTALLVTSSAHTQRVLTELVGETVNLLPVTPPADIGRTQFDALFGKWLRLADIVVLDGESLYESTRWAIESLADAKLEEHHAIVLLMPALPPPLLAAPSSWLTIPHGLPADQFKQTLTTFLELRTAQVRLQHVAPVRPRPAATPVPSGTPDLHRYRDALKNISRLLSQPRSERGERRGERAILGDFLQLARDLLSVGKLAMLMRPVAGDLFGRKSGPAGRQLRVAASDGVAREVAEHLRLSTETGIGGYVAREAKILQRAQLPELAADDDVRQAAREFELLGAEVAVPLFDDDQLIGVLTFSGKVTGEPIPGEELELVYHLVAQLGQALRNRQLTEQIADQQRLLGEVLAHVQTGVVVVNHQQRILSLNRRAAELLDLAVSDWAGQDLAKLPTRVSDVLFEALEAGAEIVQREVVLPQTNRPVSVSATRFASNAAATGQFVVVGLLEDLTQFKLAQQRAREEADRELFNRLSARLSHELKNALVSIKVFAQLLPERYQDQEFREEFGATATNEVNRVDVLVNNLTFFGHPLTLVHEELPLTELLDSCIENIAGEFARKRQAGTTVAAESDEPDAGTAVIVKKTYTHKLPVIEADKIRLQQALEHVLRNAMQAMPAGGRLIINTADAPPDDFADGKVPEIGVVRIEVQDTGEGIALDDLPHVTEPFVTTRNVGVGLGLTIVKQIVEHHGGRLEIDSMLGRGTTVTILLPVKAGLELPKISRSATATGVNAVPVTAPVEHETGI
jgi:signal transduction histidine kinase